MNLIERFLRLENCAMRQKSLGAELQATSARHLHSGGLASLHGLQAHKSILQIILQACSRSSAAPPPPRRLCTAASGA